MYEKLNEHFHASLRILHSIAVHVVNGRGGTSVFYRFIFLVTQYAE